MRIHLRDQARAAEGLCDTARRLCLAALGVFLSAVGAYAQVSVDVDKQQELEAILGEDHISDYLRVYRVDRRVTYDVNGAERTIGGAFQPSALLDSKGRIHVFFQARLDSSDDRAEKLAAYVVSDDFGRTFSAPRFLQSQPLQSYAFSAFLRKSDSGGERISVLTSVSIDETIERHKDAARIEETLGIDVSGFTRKAASLIVEFYSDDGGDRWLRKEHRGIADRRYERNGREYYLAFMNLIGQVRRIDAGPHSGRLILAGPIRGDYLPCDDHPRFREYSPSSSLIYSDDDGESWNFGGVISDSTAFEHNEASAVPVNGGRQILLVRRANARDAPGKMMHYSNDGGATWEAGIRTSIAATNCLQVLETHDDLVMCTTPGRRNRMDGRVYTSLDAGKTWTSKQIDKGMFSYSTVNRLAGPYYICAWSLSHHGEFGIGAKIFSIDWLDAP